MSRTRIAGLEIDRLTPRDAVDRIVAFAHTRDRHIVVTPNVDHMLRLRSDRAFRSAYATASLVLTDGMPLVWVSRLGNTPLPGRVAGADLVEPVLAEAEHARDRLLPAMASVRAASDELETLVADDLWPLPTYQEMLFIL